MADQWYLDLDGTRSGPYPTNEVLSLIEEGEVLPHHRISRGLRNPDWITILDWRFEQAKSSLQAPASSTSAGPKIKLNLTQKKSTAPKSEPKVEIKTELKTPLPSFSTSQPEFQKTAQPLVPPPVEPASPTRDPMAEMFDLLQNTKQKREAKQAQHPQHPQNLSGKVSGEDRGSIGKWVAICIAVAVVGLILGQVFQSKMKSTSPNPASAPTAKSEGETEIIDRSNDKMTIKTVVEKKPEPVPYNPPAPARTPYIAPTPFRRDEPAADKKRVEKELEELRDLKKELQELKSLKEQLKENPLNDEFPPGDGSAPPLEGDATGTPPTPGTTTESQF